MSESGPAESEEEEELDDQALGIKTNARSSRLSPRRKPAANQQQQQQQKSKGTGRGGGGGSVETSKRTGTAGRRAPRPQAGSCAQGRSSSESSSSESSGESSSSSDSGSDDAGARARRAGGGGGVGRGKATATASSGLVRGKVRTKVPPSTEEMLVVNDGEEFGERERDRVKSKSQGHEGKNTQRKGDGQDDDERRLQKPDEVPIGFGVCAPCL